MSSRPSRTSLSGGKVQSPKTRNAIREVDVTSAREGLLMVSALLGVIGAVLIVLAPAKQSVVLRKQTA